MKISELFKGLEIENLKEDVEVKGIACDSREVKNGFIFVAIKGRVFDGHRFIKEAERKGAVGFVAERQINTQKPYVIVKNSREFMGKIAKRFYGHRIKDLKIIGITGTNGKTTTAFFAQKILQNAGIRAANIGTVLYDTIKEQKPANRTTPESAFLFRLLSESKEAGAKVAVMEISSAGLKEKRVDEIEFFAGVFTNFSREHLEYHIDLNDYFNSKKKLFTKLRPKWGIFNADSPYSYKILKEYNGKTVTYGINNGEIKGEILEDSLRKLVIRVRGKMERTYTLPVGLKFNAYNFLAALSIAYVLGLNPDEIITHNLTTPPGRMEFVENKKGLSVFVDYAHTKEAIFKLLSYIRPYVKGRLIIVFGAGGDRDPGKRPLMGEAATTLADISIITSDNPRSEDPMKIIRDILKGIKNGSIYYIEPDREKAIEMGISMMRKDDVLIIAGKGHETYQEINGVFYPFDDRKVAKEILEGL